MRRVLALVTLAITFCLHLTAPALADDSNLSESIAQRVYNADDPTTTLESLSPTERRLFAQRLESDWTSVRTEYRLVLRAATPTEASHMAGIAERAASKCYSQYEYRKWYDLTVNTGDTWMTAHWCSNGTKITSYRLSGQGGQGYKGITYSGLGSRTTKDVGWEVRQAQQFKFSIWILGAQPCMQIRGGATGKYSSKGSCDLT